MGHARYEFSLAYLTVFGTAPRRMIQIAAETGYDYVSLRLNPVTDDEPQFPFLTDPSLVKEVRDSLEAHGIQALDVELIRTDPGVAPADFKSFIEVSAEIGARHIVTQIPEPDRAKAVDQFVEICDLAAPYNLTVDLEFIPWLPTADLDIAAGIVTQAGMVNGGILVDTLHFARSHSSVAQLMDLPRSLFNFVQLCDAPAASSMDHDELIRVARSARKPPGEADIDLRPIVEALPRVPYALEVPNEVMRKELGVVEFSRRVLESARSFLGQAEDHDASATG